MNPSQNSFEYQRKPGCGIQIGYRILSNRAEDQDIPSRATQSTDPADAIANIDVHLISTEDVYARYSCHPTVGLEAAAIQRRSKDGKNVISPPTTQYWKKILNYIFGGFNFLMWIAFIVTIISYKPLGGSNSFKVAVLLMLVIIISTTFYAVVDWNASRIMKSIKSIIAQEAAVIRDGKQQLIPATDIVVGDIVVLNAGDRVPADLRIVAASSDLRFDRSLLTGESDMVPGFLEATSDNALETGNLALTSTFVTQGTCNGLVFATGDRTVMGRIVKMSGETKFKLTTIQKEIWFFTKVISSVAFSMFGLSLLLFGVWLRASYRGYETISQAITNSIGCLTAFVPQGLPLCFALSLTIIARRVSKRHILVKNLATIETLGCMSVLCSDKTGTLTAGKMVVESIAFLDRHLLVSEIEEKISEASDPRFLAGLSALHQIARLCNGAKFDSATADRPIHERNIKGDPTDTALLRFSEALSIPALNINTSGLLSSWRKPFEIPFNSNNRWMLSIVQQTRTTEGHITKRDSTTWMLVKGAPDMLVKSCTTVMRSDGSVVPLDEASKQHMSDLQSDWSSEGQRVLALCRKPLDALKPNLALNTMEKLMYSEIGNLTLVGLVGIRDPPRPDVLSSVAVIRCAGVRVFMVTGDFESTAVAIARQVGIITRHSVDNISDVRAASAEKHLADVLPSAIKPSEDEPIRALVLTGEDVSSLTALDWHVIVGQYTEIVFARTTPDQKMKIVEEIKARGDNTVAVTGDGVNDAPALKAADIGVAMGSGSDVAKEAAALILLNNDFASIPVAIEMGRLVFDNLKKVILYLMPVGSYTEFMAVVTNVVFGMQLPLSSYLQVCFSITNDVVMSISLMYEKAEAVFGISQCATDLMLRKPRNARTDRLADWRLFFQIYLFIGLMTWPCAMSMWFVYMDKQGLGFHDVFLAYNNWTAGYHNYTQDQLDQFVNVGQCIYYVTMVFIQYGNLLAIRNRRVSLIQSNPLWGPRKNIAVPIGMVATALIAVINLYGPGFQKVFKTTPIPEMFWGPPFAFGLGILFVDEIRKLIVRTRPKASANLFLVFLILMEN
ncbi:calcium ATPase transmembrane domain M-containing protein [Suillus spraguei]|nr:calcium ATPase transmembrane domain M-containing protein [Suillus spraguei]